MRKFISVLLAGVLVLAMVGCGGKSPSGNGIEGNGGRAVSDGKMIYYVDIVQYQIRRVAVDDLSGESELVYNGGAESLSLSKDGRLYFSNSGSNTISCIKPGEDEATDFVEFNSSDVRPIVLSEDENWLYFASGSEKGEFQRGVYRINVNTSEVETVVDGKEVAAGYRGVSLVGNSLYYTVYDTEQGLMKMDILSGTSSLICEFGKGEKFAIVDLYVTDEYIYCSRESDMFIKRFDLDGKNEKIICTTDERAGIVFADKDFVYFTDGGDEVYRVKADGTGVEQIPILEDDGGWGWLSFVAGKIFGQVYFESDYDKNGVYCVDRDGKNGFRLR